MDLSKVKTPSYIIDESLLEKNLRVFDSLTKKTGCLVLLATKAFSMYHVYPLISQYLSGTSNSSYHEAKLSFEEFGKETHLYSPAFDKETFNELTQVCTSLSFNSISQWNMFKNKVPSHIDLGLRLNPQHVEVSHKLYSPCQPGSRFGVLSQDLEGLDLSSLSGVLIHALCGNNDESLERLLEAIENQFSDLISQDHIQWVNLGGGHMLTREGYNVEHCCQLICDFQSKYNVQVILEPGEAIVLNTGILVSTVLDIVQNSLDIAILDTSATAHMPDVIEMPYRPTLRGALASDKKAYTYRLGGNTCLSGDIIGEYSFDQPLLVGDRLVFEDMAQYTMVKNTTFNGLNLPSIYFLDKSGKMNLLNSFCFDDFKRRL